MSQKNKIKDGEVFKKLLETFDYNIDYFNQKLLLSLEDGILVLDDYLKIAQRYEYTDLKVVELALQKAEAVIGESGKVKDYSRIAQLYGRISTPKSKSVIQKAEVIVGESGVADDYITLAQGYVRVDRIKSKSVIQKAELVTEEHGGTVDDYVKIAKAYWYIDDITKFKSAIQKAETITERLGRGAIDDYIKIASAYGYIDENKKINSTLKKAEAMTEKTGEIDDYLKIAQEYWNIDEKIKTISILQKIEAITEKIGGIDNYLKIAQGYENVENNKTILFLQKIEAITEKIGGIDNYLKIAQEYWNIDDNNKAILLLQKAEAIAEKAGGIDDYLKVIGGYYYGVNKFNRFNRFDSINNKNRFESEEIYNFEEKIIKLLENIIIKFDLFHFLGAKKYFELSEKYKKEANPSRRKEFLIKTIDSNDENEYIVSAIDNYVEILLADNNEENEEVRFQAMENYLDKGRNIIRNIIKDIEDDDLMKSLENSIARKESILESFKKNKQKEREVKEKEAKLDEQAKNKEEEISKSILKKRIDLEYALNKSAIEELGFDKKEFYNEVDNKIHNKFKKEEEIKKETNDIINKLGDNVSEDDKKKIREALCSYNKGYYERLKKDNIKNKKEQLNFVLPTLRASYLGEWKEFLMDAGRKIIKNEPANQILRNDIELIDSKMACMIGKFDEILGKDQDRNLKSKIFTWVIIFLIFETIIIFGLAAFIIFLNKPEHKDILNILIPATILQIAGMLYYIVRSLFPKGADEEETEKELMQEIKREKLRKELDVIKNKKDEIDKIGE